MTKLKATRVLSNLLIATLPALAVSLFMPGLGVFAADSGEFHFTILHTNDIHAHDEPFWERGKEVGGVARIATLIQQFRKEIPNIAIVDAGDIFQGTSFFKFYHGEVEVEMLNRAGYDIYTIGNHEFDDGPDNLAKQLKKAKFDVINSNIDATANPALASVFKPSVIRTIGGQRVGFIGAITPSLTEVSLTTKGVGVKNSGPDWMKPINDEISKLKSQGIDKIVLVTHTGLELDRELAKNPDVDVIIGGHSHTRLDKAVIVPHENGTNAIVVQTGSYGRALGKLDLAFDEKGNLDVANTHYRLINVDRTTPAEPTLAAYLKEKSKPFEALRNQVDGIADGDFDNYFRSYPGDSALGDLITDALAEGAKAQGATISMENRGGIRGRIERGLVTEEKVQEVLPFENKLVIATVSGATLLKALENSVSGALGARFLDVHGMKFGYNADHPTGERILWAYAADTNGKWGKIVPDKKYRIAINDYSFGGGEGYDFSKATDVVRTDKQLSYFLTQYLLKSKHVHPRTYGRIVPYGEVTQKRNRAAHSHH